MALDLNHYKVGKVKSSHYLDSWFESNHDPTQIKTMWASIRKDLGEYRGRLSGLTSADAPEQSVIVIDVQLKKYKSV